MNKQNLISNNAMEVYESNNSAILLFQNLENGIWNRLFDSMRCMSFLWIYALVFYSFNLNLCAESYSNSEELQVLQKDYVSRELIIKFKEHVTAAEITQLCSDFGLELKRSSFTGAGLYCTQDRTVTEVLAELDDHESIEYAHPNHMFNAISLPDDPELPRQWNLGSTEVDGLGDIQVTKAWPLESTTNRVVVAVIDTGINYQHPDLTGKIWTNSDEIPGNLIDDDDNGYVDDIVGYDFVISDEDDLIPGEQPGHDNDPMDRDGSNHGTGVAGVIAAVRNNTFQIAGVTASAEIMPLRSAYRSPPNPDIGKLDYTLTGNVFAMIECIGYAINNGADIINISSQISYPVPLLKSALTTAKNEGILVVSGISNNSTDVDSTELDDVLNNLNGSPGSDGIPDRISYPANFTFDYDNDTNIDDDNVLIVTATNPSGRLSNFASYGSQSVDIGAPGEFIPTLKADGTWGYTSGISVAVAHVSGVAAMVLAKEPNLDPVTLKYRIMANGDSVPSLNSTTVSGGRLNAYKAMTAATTANQPAWWTAETTRIIKPGRIADNYAPVTLGQLKHVAQKARDYLEDGNGGAGSIINAMVDGFTSYETNNPNHDEQNFYAPVNLGQLKAVAKPFYDKLADSYDTRANLIRRGYPVSWPHATPWDLNTPTDDNYAMVTLGQLKMVFSFDFSNNSIIDDDGDFINDFKDADPTDFEIGELSIKIISPLGGNI